ncbi:MAG TPA: HAMP domain-containing sensor histidine kinase [Ktedonobacteraceae bacterium]|jgi:two-component system OmpR family sensor kinase|nr:HAMP domain-containing sensor histidine kinase [Ktedonobacteraceae bacterium]
MWRMKRLRRLVNRIPLRWRLTLISLGVLALLLSALGLVILFTAEQALLSNEAVALRNEARLAADGIKGHPFFLASPPGPPQGSLPPDFNVPATILVEKLASASVNATVLSLNDQVIVSGNELVGSNFPLTPLPVTLKATLIQQTLANDAQGSSYLIARDVRGNRQLVVLMPVVSQHQTIAILQLNTPTAPYDDYITTLRLILLIGVLGALSFAITLTFPLIGAALHPLVVMERTSRRIANVNLSLRLDTPVTDDEIGHLAVSFNWMVAQLEAAFKRQKQFVADVSHELRTPLTALSGSLEMLLIGADQGDVQASRRLMRNMYAEVQRMHRLVEDLLALTRLDEGKMVLRVDTIDVRPVIEKVYDQAQQLAHGQEIRYEVAADILPVRADVDRLQQVLLNIADNALKFTPSEGLVELSAYNEGQAAVIIKIHDTGKGIPPDALPHVFDRFYRADPARTRQLQSATGNGLGLALAKELIEAQGGTISIDSVQGEGTTVMVKLKAA